MLRAVACWAVRVQVMTRRRGGWEAKGMGRAGGHSPEILDCWLA